VRTQCLELSLRHWDIGQHGVWGGLVPADRAALRRRKHPSTIRPVPQPRRPGMGNTTRGDLLTSPQKRDPATPADADATLRPVSIRAEALRTGPSVSHMRGRMSQGDRAASKGLPTTGELDASTTTYWNSGTSKASLQRRHHPLEGRPGALRGRARPQPVKFLMSVDTRTGQFRPRKVGCGERGLPRGPST